MAKGFGLSPIGNTIFYGTINREKRMFTGKKEDVTDEAIRVVFEWFMGNMKGNDEYHITFENIPYELIMRRKEIEDK